MINDEINSVREILHGITRSGDLTSANAIKTSKEMDNLIMEYYTSWEKSLQEKA